MGFILDPFQTITAFHTGVQLYRKLMMITTDPRGGPLGNDDLLYDDQVLAAVSGFNFNSRVWLWNPSTEAWSLLTPKVGVDNNNVVILNPSPGTSFAQKAGAFADPVTAFGLDFFEELDYTSVETIPLGGADYSNSITFADVGPIIVNGYGVLTPLGFLPETITFARDFFTDPSVIDAERILPLYVIGTIG